MKPKPIPPDPRIVIYRLHHENRRLLAELRHEREQRQNSKQQIDRLRDILAALTKQRKK